MPDPTGFDFVRRGDDVLITHHGRRATTLRGRRAQEFLEDVEIEDAQLLMARMTGNYKHGNERRGREGRGARGR